MNTDRVKGTIDEVVGGAKRKAGELTGDTKLQVEGVVQQVQGKIENALGKAKDAVHEANKEAEVKHDPRTTAEFEPSTVKVHGNKTA